MLTPEMSIAVFTGKWNDCMRREKRHLPLRPAFSTHPRAKQLTLSAKVKSLFLAIFLCLPCSWLALSIADNTRVPDSLRYVFSPGTMLATSFSHGSNPFVARDVRTAKPLDDDCCPDQRDFLQYVDLRPRNDFLRCKAL